MITIIKKASKYFKKKKKANLQLLQVNFFLNNFKTFFLTKDCIY